MFYLKIINVINSEFAVSPEDGDSIFNLIISQYYYFPLSFLLCLYQQLYLILYI